jgi:hypothetical protein
MPRVTPYPTSAVVRASHRSSVVATFLESDWEVRRGQMLRFNVNRQFALTLALAACLAACSVAPVGATGAVPGKPGPDTGGETNGDPDLPTGPSRSPQVGAQRSSGTYEARTTIAGDDRITGDAWVWRFRVVLQSLRAFYIRY